jgi:hypothetical protein
MFWHFCLVWQLFWLLYPKIGRLFPNLMVALLETDGQCCNTFFARRANLLKWQHFRLLFAMFITFWGSKMLQGILKNGLFPPIFIKVHPFLIPIHPKQHSG